MKPRQFTPDEWLKLTKIARSYKKQWDESYKYRGVEDAIIDCELELHQLRSYLDKLGYIYPKLKNK